MNTCYGYKICYREEGSKQLIRKFKTRTLKKALKAKKYFVMYPPQKIKNPRWYIIPINKNEIKRGIWREVPFDDERRFFIYKKI